MSREPYIDGHLDQFGNPAMTSPVPSEAAVTEPPPERRVGAIDRRRTSAEESSRWDGQLRRRSPVNRRSGAAAAPSDRFHAAQVALLNHPDCRWHTYGEADPDSDLPAPSGKCVPAIAVIKSLNALRSAHLSTPVRPDPIREAHAGSPETPTYTDGDLDEFGNPSALPSPVPLDVDLPECAICGDYSAQGVEVHESCLPRPTEEARLLDAIAHAVVDLPCRHAADFGAGPDVDPGPCLVDSEEVLAIIARLSSSEPPLTNANGDEPQYTDDPEYDGPLPRDGRIVPEGA